jgi:hypothetical protein
MIRKARTSFQNFFLEVGKTSKLGVKNQEEEEEKHTREQLD